jgi:hypothetical protein
MQHGPCGKPVCTTWLYVHASRREKGQHLDEFCAITGCNPQARAGAAEPPSRRAGSLELSRTTARLWTG